MGRLHVEDTVGFAVGDNIYIEEVQYSEMKKVVNVNLKFLQLDSKLWHIYPAGSAVRVAPKRTIHEPDQRHRKHKKARVCKKCRGNHRSDDCTSDLQRQVAMGMQMMMGMPMAMPLSMQMGWPIGVPMSLPTVPQTSVQRHALRARLETAPMSPERHAPRARLETPPMSLGSPTMHSRSPLDTDSVENTCSFEDVAVASCLDALPQRPSQALNASSSYPSYDAASWRDFCSNSRSRSPARNIYLVEESATLPRPSQAPHVKLSWPSGDAALHRGISDGSCSSSLMENIYLAPDSGCMANSVECDTHPFEVAAFENLEHSEGRAARQKL